MNNVRRDSPAPASGAVGELHGPCNNQVLKIETTANGVIVNGWSRENGPGWYSDKQENVAVFNDPKEFAEWCEAWMRRMRR